MSEKDKRSSWLEAYAAKMPEGLRAYFIEFIPPWLETHLGTIPEAEREKFLHDYETALVETLQLLEKLPLNQFKDGSEEGHYSIRIGKSDVFVNLKSALWTATKYAGPVAVVAIVSPALLAALGIAVPHLTAGATASSAALLYKAFAKLQPMELDTYEAVAAAIERNRKRVLANSGAAIEDVRKSFDLNGDLLPPKDLPAMLNQLVDKKVLDRNVEGGVEQFFLAF
jgi:hypothetical protein